MIARIGAIFRMLLGIKTERERQLEREFARALAAHQRSTQALTTARHKVEQARHDIHARVSILDEQTGEFKSGTQ